MDDLPWLMDFMDNPIEKKHGQSYESMDENWGYHQWEAFSTWYHQWETYPMKPFPQHDLSAWRTQNGCVAPQQNFHGCLQVESNG